MMLNRNVESKVLSLWQHYENSLPHQPGNNLRIPRVLLAKHCSQMPSKTKKRIRQQSRLMLIGSKLGRLSIAAESQSIRQTRFIVFFKMVVLRDTKRSLQQTKTLTLFLKKLVLLQQLMSSNLHRPLDLLKRSTQKKNAHN